MMYVMFTIILGIALLWKVDRIRMEKRIDDLKYAQEQQEVRLRGSVQYWRLRYENLLDMVMVALSPSPFDDDLPL